jgi:hypothetical protein
VGFYHHLAPIVHPSTITKKYSPHKPATMLVEGWDCRTQFWKGITHGPFQQRLVLSGQVVSEENIF